MSFKKEEWGAQFILVYFLAVSGGWFCTSFLDRLIFNSS